MSQVEAYYDERPEQEWERLDRARTELGVTLRVLRDYLPTPPSRVLDIGGGPGRYAITLAQQGYEVTLADVSAKCLELAREKQRQAGVELAGLVHANATDMSYFPDMSFDAVLMMGPLYHLLQERERRQAVAEAFRLLKPGGLIFAAFLTRFSALRWAAKCSPERILRRDDQLLETGLPADSAEQGGFPGYFSHPTEIEPLMESSGFETVDLVGCEGVVSRLDERINELTGELWEAWVELNYRLGHDRTLHGAADHLLYVGTKRGMDDS